MKERMQNLVGKSILTVSGQKYRLSKIAGYGNQGLVYECDSPDRMIKFYYPSGDEHLDNEQFERLQFIQSITNDNKLKNFVKVYDIINHPYIGYVMEKVVGHSPLNSYLIPKDNDNFSDWYNKGKGFRERLSIGCCIAKAFSELEKNNLSYCDISGNNILVKTTEKEYSVKMIDVDNIYIAGKSSATVLGTPRYIAPEVISRQKNPDILSDNYSLAVILFELLRTGHPYISDSVLDGTPEDEDAALAGKFEYVTYENSTNMLPADVVFTEKLRKLFEKCFVAGKQNRILRPSAHEFETALIEASNKIIKCTSCGYWHYPRKEDLCPWCDSTSKPKAFLTFYDILCDGNNYKKLTPINNGQKPFYKAVNSYILKDEKNYIKNFYVLRSEENLLDVNISTNYMIIAKAKGSSGYWAYNKFKKRGIVIQKFGAFYEVKNEKGSRKEYCKSGEFIELKENEAIKLSSRDCIFFDLNIVIEIDGKHYSFIRMASFWEEDK